MSAPQKTSLGADAHEIYTRRKGRNLALGGVLVGLVVMIFLVTIVKLSQGVDMRGFDHTFETVPGADE